MSIHGVSTWHSSAAVELVEIAAVRTHASLNIDLNFLHDFRACPKSRPLPTRLVSLLASYPCQSATYLTELSGASTMSGFTTERISTLSDQPRPESEPSKKRQQSHQPRQLLSCTKCRERKVKVRLSPFPKLDIAAESILHIRFTHYRKLMAHTV